MGIALKDECGELIVPGLALLKGFIIDRRKGKNEIAKI